MRFAPRRLTALLTAASLATLTVLTATSAPAHADGGFTIEMQGFDEYPGTGDIEWPVTLVNDTDRDLVQPTFFLSLFEEEDALSALVLSTANDACEKNDTDTGMNITCVFPTLAANSATTIDFTMSLRDGADRVHHGLSYVQSSLRQMQAPDRPTYAEKMVTLDAGLPLNDDGRLVDITAPEQVGAEQVLGDNAASGERLSFTVVNDDYDPGTLTGADLVVDVDEQTGIVPTTKLDDCEYSQDDTRLTCPMADLGVEDRRDYTFTLWARSADAWKDAEPGTVNIDVVLAHGDHTDTWAHADTGITLVKGDGDGTLPKTGSALTTPIAVGAAALILGAATLLVTRRRRTTGGVTTE